MPAENNALALLVDDELCEALTKDGWREVMWSVERQCFFYAASSGGTICPNEDIVEWVPGSVKF